MIVGRAPAASWALPGQRNVRSRPTISARRSVDDGRAVPRALLLDVLPPDPRYNNSRWQPDQLDAQNPWPGLDAFEESAHRFFHGREGEADALRRSVLDSPITVLYGRSGLGKTSLLQAALFPTCATTIFLPIYVRLDFTATALPIADQLRETLREVLRFEVPDARLPGDHESVWEYLHRVDFELWSTRNFLLTPVLVIDQFEEVFTLGRHVPGLVERFRNDLGDLVENRIPAELAARIEDDEEVSANLALRSRQYKILVSLREDFLPDLDSWRTLVPMLGRPRLRLLPMNTDAALEAVRSRPRTS